MIKVYSKNNCVKCKMVKRWLTEHNITFTEINVDEDLQALNHLIEINQRSLPVVFKDDDIVSIGFNPSELTKL